MRRPVAEHNASNIDKVLSFSAYRALVDLFPRRQQHFNQLMKDLGYDWTDVRTDTTTPNGIGNVGCELVLNQRHRDGSNQLGDRNQGVPYSDYTNYEAINTWVTTVDANRWQPIVFLSGDAPSFQTPHWGLVLPFAITPESLRPPPPPRFPEARYKEQVKAVLQVSAALTDEQKMIAEYWADGPASELPPGHWNALAQVVSQRDHHTVSDDVKLFFALNNALLDAGIAAWECKRFYDYVRPVTAVRFLFGGQVARAWAGPYQGTRYVEGSRWLPYQLGSSLTPPFPEYVSGHSTFSAAAAEILKQFTGSDHFDYHVTLLPGSSRIEPGLTPAQPVRLFWSTFSDAADQAGLSRQYGGIHFADSDVAGRKLGRKVGALVWVTARQLFEGHQDVSPQ